MVGTAVGHGRSGRRRAVRRRLHGVPRGNGGAWVKGTSVTVSDEADYTVEYRSADKAGNVEAAKSVSFTIEAPVACPTPTATPTATADGDPGTPTPTATPAPPAPKPTPSFTLAKPVQDHGRQVRQERPGDPGDLHRRDERSGDGHGGQQDQEGAEAEVGDAGQGHAEVHRPASRR